MNKTRISAVAGLAALGFAGLASATPFGPASLTSGDLTFSDFEASLIKCNNTADCAPNKVKKISVFAAPGGIDFQSTFQALDVGKPETEDVLISYEVTAPSKIIEDIFLGLPAGVSVLGNGSILSITEAAWTNANPMLGTEVGSVQLIDTDPPTELTADVDLTGGPYSELFITKDISYTAACTPKKTCLSDGPVEVTFSDVAQEFSTVSVPEPGMLALLGGSLLGFGLWMRRRVRV